MNPPASAWGGGVAGGVHLLLTCLFCSWPPSPAPALGGCGSARTCRALAPAPCRVGPTSPPTTRNFTTCMATAATFCPRSGHRAGSSDTQALRGSSRPFRPGEASTMVIEGRMSLLGGTLGPHDGHRGVVLPAEHHGAKKPPGPETSCWEVIRGAKGHLPTEPHPPHGRPQHAFGGPPHHRARPNAHVGPSPRNVLMVVSPCWLSCGSAD